MNGTSGERCDFWWVEDDGTPHSCFDFERHTGPHTDILGTTHLPEK